MNVDQARAANQPPPGGYGPPGGGYGPPGYGPGAPGGYGGPPAGYGPPGYPQQPAHPPVQPPKPKRSTLFRNLGIVCVVLAIVCGLLTAQRSFNASFYTQPYDDAMAELQAARKKGNKAAIVDKLKQAEALRPAAEQATDDVKVVEIPAGVLFLAAVGCFVLHAATSKKR